MLLNVCMISTQSGITNLGRAKRKLRLSPRLAHPLHIQSPPLLDFCDSKPTAQCNGLEQSGRSLGRVPTRGSIPAPWLAPLDHWQVEPLQSRRTFRTLQLPHHARPSSSKVRSCLARADVDYYPPYNATCVDLLLGAGAHIAGQTKMDEFGMGSETTHLPPDYSPVYNPIPSDPPRSAGGSSGGSAVAVGEGSAWA